MSESAAQILKYKKVSEDRAKELLLIALMVDALASAGFHVSFFYDNQTILYGADVKVGIVVGDLSKEHGTAERILLKAQPGEWDTTKVIKELSVLTSTDIEKSIKGKLVSLKVEAPTI